MKKLVGLLTAVCLLFVLAACGTGDRTTEQPAATQQPVEQPDATQQPVEKDQDGVPDFGYRLDTLKLAGNTDWGAPSPYLQDPRGPGTSKVKKIFDSLLDADEQGILPWLAKEWHMEGNVYTFTIFDNASFHDGKPVTTEDIAFSIDYYNEFPPINNYLAVGGKSIVEAYEIVDAYTIKLEVASPLATTLERLGSFLILPKHIWESVEEPYTYNEPDAFIGSGGYRFGAYEPATGSYEFIAYEHYHGRRPVAERVLFVPTSDNLLAFENREIDITDVPIDVMDRYAGNPDVGTIGKDNDVGYKMLINMERLTKFKEFSMREAVYKALNRSAVVEKVFRGSGDIASAGYVPVTSVFYNDQVVQYDYDPQFAKNILSGQNLSVELLISSSGDDVKIAELIKYDLQQAGMQVTVTAFDGKVRDERIFAGNYDFALVGNGGWSRTPDYLRTLYSSQSKFTGTNPHFMGAIGHDSGVITQLAEEQLKALDFDKRKELLKELQYEISKEIPIIIIATRTSYVMFMVDYYGDWVKTYDYQQLEQNRLSYFEKE